jgi:hypothetical protein
MPRKRGTSAAHLPPWGFRCLARRPTRTARVSAAGKGGVAARRRGRRCRKWGRPPKRWSGAPGRQNSAPAPNGGVQLFAGGKPPRWPANAPAGWNSAPAALRAAPERNRGGVFRAKSPVSGRKAAPGVKISRVERENEFIAGIRFDGRDWSTDPARGVSPTSRTLPAIHPPSVPQTPSASSPPHAPVL